MKTIEEIKISHKGTKKKLKEHEDRIRQLNIQNNLNAQKTSAYMQGWINALKWVEDKQ